MCICIVCLLCISGSEGGLSQWIPLEHGIEVELSLSVLMCVYV